MKKIKLLLLTLLLSLTSCGQKDDYKLTIVSPSGAPAISIADLAYNQKDEYNFVLNKTPDILQASFLGNETDIILAPINMGATMYNKTGNYVLGAMVTWGNLYFASRIENFTLETMNDKDVVFFGEGTINQYVVESVLTYNNITPKSITYLGATNLTQGQLIANENTIALVAEPALSVAKSKVEGITSISVQDLYASMTNSTSYPQAGCFIRKQTIEEHKNVVDSFLKDLKDSCTKVNKDVSTIAQYSEELEFGGTKAVLENAIPNSNINFVKAKDSQEQINTLFKDALKYCGGKLPDDNFYYKK